MADFLEDVGVGYYRSLDPPKNFVVKVNLRRVTAASYLPEFKFGSQHNVNDQEGAEVAGEALEMQGLRQNQGKPPDQDSEESMFYWQQKMFSQREMELYGDLTNCFGPLEQKYHAEILKLRKKGGRPNRRLFSYVDCDSYVNVDEESRPLTTSPTEVPSYLTKNMTTVRRRNIGTRVDRRNKPGGFITRTDPIVVHETETSKTTAHVVNIPYKTMHVMADLAPEGKAEIDQNDEYVLFSIKIDANGQIFVKPDFNGEKPPYRIETQNDLREVYEYTIEHCSVQMTSDQREQEFKSFNELYNRHALYLASQVGSGFETMPEPGVLRMNILGEIVSAKGFDYDGLYVHFFLDLPEKWRPTDDPVLSGVTQTCMTKLEGEDYVAHFSFPFDFSLIYQEDDDCDDFIHWPTLFLEVLSLDSWERFRAEGYAYITIPSKAGSYSMEVNTWRPIGNGTGPEMRRFFIGGSPELEDPTYPQKPAMADDKVLSKYFFRTAGSGSVNVKFHVMQQCQSFMDSKAKKTRRTRTILDRLGGMNALDSLAQVMDAFQRAKKRMLDAREGLPSVK